MEPQYSFSPMQTQQPLCNNYMVYRIIQYINESTQMIKKTSKLYIVDDEFSM